MADKLKLHAEQNMLLLAKAGSHSYGLADEFSDYDYRGIFFEPVSSWLGNSPIEQIDSGWAEYKPARFSQLQTKDVCIYGLKKFIKLATACNPNILELLFCQTEFESKTGLILKSHRQLFLSQLAKKSFYGYAMGQLKKIESHKLWLESSAVKPDPNDYGLMLSKTEFNALAELAFMLLRNTLEYGFIAEELRDEFFERADFKLCLQQASVEQLSAVLNCKEEVFRQYQATKAYFNAKRKHEAYLDWQKNRNKARAGLEAKVGYDSKHASHCIRLLAMGIELLGSGKLIVNRREAGDADYLLKLKRGNVPYEEFIELSKQLISKFNSTNSRLPAKPDFGAIEALTADLAKCELKL